MSDGKFNIKIDNKPILPDVNIIDVSKEVNNTEAFQKLRESLDEKEKERFDVDERRHKEIQRA